MKQKTANNYPWQPQVVDNWNGEATVDLLDMLYYFWGHLRQIIVWMILGAVVGVVYTWGTGYQNSCQYQVAAQVYFSPSVAIDSDDMVKILQEVSGDGKMLAEAVDIINGWESRLEDTSMIADYTTMLLSRTVLQNVTDKLSLDMDPAVLENMIVVESQENSHVVKITVTSSDAQQAANIANELVSQGEICFQKYVGIEPPKVLDSAEVSGASLVTGKLSYIKNAGLFALLVVALYCVFLLVRFLMNDTIVTPDNIEKYFGVQPLATIPKSNLENIKNVRTGKVR